MINIYNHVDDEKLYGENCAYCDRDIFKHQKIVSLLDFPKTIKLHNECYEPYMVERFKKRYLIAGVSDE